MAAGNTRSVLTLGNLFKRPFVSVIWRPRLRTFYLLTRELPRGRLILKNKKSYSFFHHILRTHAHLFEASANNIFI